MTGIDLGYIGPSTPFVMPLWQGVALVGIAPGFWYWFRRKRD